MRVTGIVELYDVEIPGGLMRNFSGAQYKFKKGERPTMIAPSGGMPSFCAFLSEEQAADLIEKGWNVRYTKPREDGDEPRAFIRINVAFGKYPPTIKVIQGKHSVEYNKEDLHKLDGMSFEPSGVRIRPYNSENGVSAYLVTGLFVIKRDLLAERYEGAVMDELADEEETPW